MYKPNVKEALSVAVAVIYFDDSSDYSAALWEVVTALGGKEAADLLEEDGHAAYEKYCEDRRREGPESKGDGGRE